MWNLCKYPPSSRPPHNIYKKCLAKCWDYTFGQAFFEGSDIAMVVHCILFSCTRRDIPCAVCCLVRVTRNTHTLSASQYKAHCVRFPPEKYHKDSCAPCENKCWFCIWAASPIPSRAHRSSSRWHKVVIFLYYQSVVVRFHLILCVCVCLWIWGCSRLLPFYLLYCCVVQLSTHI